MTATEIATVLVSYGIGCLNAGYYLLRWHDGRDIRDLGSGNAGARNAGRVLGRAGFALVFALDASKGLLAVLGARLWAPDMVAPCAVAATLGHVYPVQLGGRGGKGVATAIGGLALIDPAVLGVVAMVFATLRPLLGRTVPAGMLGFAGGAAWALAFRPEASGVAALALAALLSFTHRPGRTA